MDRETYEKGREIRTTVLGAEYVQRAAADADEFSQPLQDLVTEYCWGSVWGRDGLPLKTRSMLNLAMIAVLNRPRNWPPTSGAPWATASPATRSGRSSCRSASTPGSQPPSTASQWPSGRGRRLGARCRRPQRDGAGEPAHPAGVERRRIGGGPGFGGTPVRRPVDGGTASGATRSGSSRGPRHRGPGQPGQRRRARHRPAPSP